ncbi:MAG: transporter [Tunicatimonas sp.]
MKTIFLLLSTILLSNLLSAQISNVTSRLEVYNIETGERRVVYEEDTHFEAPNWSPDGTFFLVNGSGSLYRIPVDGSDKQRIDTGFADKCNNDHGFMPDGQTIIMSHYDQPDVAYADLDFMTSRIYTLPIGGSKPQPVTPNTPSFWHGVSPNGQTLFYAALRNDDIDVYAIDVEGGNEKQLTHTPGLDDGPEMSSDGKHIYFNSMRSGKMELWRMRADGSKPTQLTDDAYSNWFPHPSPDGKSLAFISYLQDQGDAHPAMKDVALRLYDLSTGKINELTRLTGGQGTINVPSWSPDGKQFAFVSYERIDR